MSRLPAPDSSTKLAVRMLLPRGARSTRRSPGVGALTAADSGPGRSHRDPARTWGLPAGAAWHACTILRASPAGSVAPHCHYFSCRRGRERGKQDRRTYLRATIPKHGYALLRRGGAPAASPPPAAGRSEAAPCGSGQRPRLAPGPRDAAATHGPHQPPPASWRTI